jgi:hypothetical protein
VSADYPSLLAQARHTVTQIESLLSRLPFHVKNSNVPGTSQSGANPTVFYLKYRKNHAATSSNACINCYGWLSPQAGPRPTGRRRTPMYIHAG